MIAPCPTLYVRRNKLGTTIDVLEYYREKSVIDHEADPTKVDIDFGGKIVLGNFVNIDKPTYLENLDASMKKSLGDDYSLNKEYYMRPASHRAMVDRGARHE